MTRSASRRGAPHVIDPVEIDVDPDGNTSLDGLHLIPTVGAFVDAARRGGSLTWFARRLSACVFRAQFELGRGRDAPTVLDNLLAELLVLRDLRTCDRYRR